MTPGHSWESFGPRQRRPEEEWALRLLPLLVCLSLPAFSRCLWRDQLVDAAREVVVTLPEDHLTAWPITPWGQPRPWGDVSLQGSRVHQGRYLRPPTQFASPASGARTGQGQRIQLTPPSFQPVRRGNSDVLLLCVRGEGGGVVTLWFSVWITTERSAIALFFHRLLPTKLYTFQWNCKAEGSRLLNVFGLAAWT